MAGPRAGQPEAPLLQIALGAFMQPWKPRCIWVAGTSPARTSGRDGPERCLHDGQPAARHVYIGVTSDLLSRAAQHREGLVDGFTKRHGVKRLVWFERHDSIVAAIQREKSIKKYKREWKVNLIERENPKWADPFPLFFVEQGPLAHLQAYERPL